MHSRSPVLSKGVTESAITTEGAAKICTKCQREKPLEEFYKRSDKPGRIARCRSCVYKSTRAYLLAHPDIKRAANRRQDALPHRRLKGAKRAAKRRGLSWELSDDDSLALMLAPCVYCGKTKNLTGSGIDRKFNGPAYTKETSVSCCGVCNRVKSDYFTYEEMMRLGAVIKEIEGERCANR